MYGVSPRPGLRKLNPWRIHSGEVNALAIWGAAAGTTAVWLIQPFSWFKKTFIDQTTTDP